MARVIVIARSAAGRTTTNTQQQVPGDDQVGCPHPSLLRTVGVLLGAVALIWSLTSTAAEAQEGPSSLEELLESFGVADQPIDLVILLDTSTSMIDPAAGNPYPAVRDAVAEFIGLLGNGDHLTLVTFDVDAEELFRGEIDDATDQQQAIDRLPDPVGRPDDVRRFGEATDIGRGLALAVDALDRGGANEVKLLLFLTDGELFIPADSDSPFRDVGSDAWQQLEATAQQIEQRSRMIPFGLGLIDGGGSTDVGLLDVVFTAPTVISLPAEQLPSRVREAVLQARRELLRTPIESELERRIRISAELPDGLQPQTTVRLTVESMLTTLPVRVTIDGATLTLSDGQTARAVTDGGPVTLVVEPGEEAPPVDLTALLDLPTDDGGFQVETTLEYDVDVDVDVSAAVAEPRQLINNELGIDTTGIVVIQPDPLREALGFGISPTDILIWLVTLLTLLLAALWAWWRFLKLPPLVGFAFELDRDQSQLPLTGTSTVIPGRTLTLPEARDAKVEFFTQRRKRRKVYARTKERPVEVRFTGGVWEPLTGQQQVRVNDELRIGEASGRLVKTRKQKG
jgi:hypothetical protein